ncbi:MAG: nuclear transport factor 2 family protein, partial [Pseudolabrys sp.]|nr:nuclear transport factor 2 family protein [Pseudolabrys sp.]
MKRVIQTYLDGLYEGDAEKIASVFHPTSALKKLAGRSEGVFDGNPEPVLKLDKFLDRSEE